MAKEREARKQSSFFKFLELGDMAAGTVKEWRNSANGPFVILMPACLRNGRKGTVAMYESASISISTDMSSKLSRSDVDKDISITFNDTEPTNKGSDKKIFRVLELDKSEVAKLASVADKSHRNEPYIVEPKAAKKDEPADEPGELADDDDELPF